MVSEERSLDLFLTVQQECCIPFQALLHEHSSVITVFIMLLWGEICSCACPNPRGVCKKGTKPEEHWVTVCGSGEEKFLNAGLFIRFLLLAILLSLCRCQLGLISCSVLGRLDISALLECLFQNVLRVTPCRIRGVDKHKEGGAVGMFHVIVSLGKCLWCVVGMYCFNQEQ